MFAVPCFASFAPLSHHGRLQNRASAPARARANRRVIAMSAKRVLVAVADGSEEIETATAVDVLRRAGADLTMASVGEQTRCKLSRGMIFEADALMADAAVSGGGGYDAVLVPGGMPGAQKCYESAPLKDVLQRTAADGGIVGAICAAPAVVLAAHGMLQGRRATCYPADAFVSAMPQRVDGDVVVDGPFVTATGPGTALAWALKVVELLYDEATRDKVAGAMLVDVPAPVS